MVKIFVGFIVEGWEVVVSYLHQVETDIAIQVDGMFMIHIVKRQQIL